MNHIDTSHLNEVPGYKGAYYADEQGNIWTVKRNRLRKRRPGFVAGGYLAVSVAKSIGNGRIALVHRMVAAAFFGDQPNLQVNHKNGIRDDNRIENLEWVTVSENQLHAFRVLGKGAKMNPPKGISHANSCPVAAYKDGVMVAHYSNECDAAKAMGVRPCTINGAVMKRQKTCRGMVWERISKEQYYELLEVR